MSRPPHPLAATPSRTAQVAEWFAREIRSGRIAQGDKLPTEQELIGRFGVSRTVIREAMASLRTEGLVISRQGSGVFVGEPKGAPTFRIGADEMRSLTDIGHVLQLRLAVEVEAAALAAAHRTRQDLEAMAGHLEAIDAAINAGDSAVTSDFAFHQAISTATGNPYFERFLHFLGPVLIPRQSVRVTGETPEERRIYLTHVQAEHQRIYRAIKRSNVEAARLTLREHLEASRERYARMSARPFRL